MCKVIKFKYTETDVVYIVTNNKGVPYLYANKYLKFLMLTGRTTNTIKSYAYRLKIYFDFLEYYNLDFSKVNMEDFIKYIGWLNGEKSIGTKKREAKTINYNIAAVINFYDYLTKFHEDLLANKLDYYTESIKRYSYKSFLHHIQTNVKYKLNVLKVREINKPYKILKNEQLKRIFNCSLHIRNRLLLQILYETGVRISEALNIKLEDINISNKEILITKSKTPSGEYRKVYLSAETVNLLQDHIYEIHEKNNFDSNYLFLKLTGENRGLQCDYETIESVFRNLSTKLGFKVTPHMFRHTLATELNENGVDPSIIKQLLGHKDVQTTLNMYIHPSEESLKKEFNKVRLNRIKDITNDY